jgi:hypothetical protein
MVERRTQIELGPAVTRIGTCLQIRLHAGSQSLLRRSRRDPARSRSEHAGKHDHPDPGRQKKSRRFVSAKTCG